MQSRRKARAGGGWPAIIYTVGKALEVGPWRLWQRMRSKNACKTCAVGMGGQLGGMVNEAGHFPEICKKSLQAQVADMKGAIAPEYFERNSISQLLILTPKQAEDAGRLAFPMFIGASQSHFHPVAWEAAVESVARALKEAQPERVAFYSSGRSSNEAAFLLQSFARLYGTNHVMNCSYYCHQASGIALKMAFGTSTATITLDDVDKADLVFLCGTNPASNHPRMMTKLADLRRRGGQVVVINPVLEPGLERFHVPSRPLSLMFGSPIASLYVQPLAGGDAAFFVGVLKALTEQNLTDKEFLAKHAEGAEAVLSEAASMTWEEIERKSGVTREVACQVASLVSSSRNAIFAWAMGLTHHTSGVENILALCNVAIAAGHVGRPGAGLLPMRGHSNVQGVGSVGFTPALQDAVRQALEKAYGRALPATAGYDTHAMIEAAERGEIDVLIALGGNVWGSNPDLTFAERAMSKIKTTVYLSTKLNPGHFHGRGQNTFILPVLARDEEPQATTQESMFNFVRLSEGGAANVPGTMRSESHIICDLANAVLGSEPVDWTRLRNHRAVRELIADVIPGWQEIARLDDTKKEFTVAGRIIHSPVFNTDSGRAKMHPTPLPDYPENTLRLITLRSEGQFNTVVYEEHDIYRGMPHRHCLLISRQDALSLSLTDGQRVAVVGEAGRLDNIEVVYGNIKPGVVAMFYPEANVLLKGVTDPRSKTPNFKSAPVWIETKAPAPV